MSLGAVYEAATEFCGFRNNYDEGKTMGLAPLGNPDTFGKTVAKIFWINEDMSVGVDLSYFDYQYYAQRCGKKFYETFGQPREKTKKGDVRWVAQLYKKHDVLQWKKVGGKPKLTGGWAAQEADRLIKEGIALVDQIKGFGNPEQAEKFKSLMRFMARRDT